MGGQTWWCSIRSCACIASTRTRRGRSRLCSPICASCSAATGIAVIVVHHAKKGAPRTCAPAKPCGSSEFHAWGDSNLYLRRAGEELTLTVEHRAAPAMPTIALELAQRAGALALQAGDQRTLQTPPHRSVDERIAAALADRPPPFAELRALCRVRTATLYERLAALTAQGSLIRSDDGYRLGAS